MTSLVLARQILQTVQVKLSCNLLYETTELGVRLFQVGAFQIWVGIPVVADQRLQQFKRGQTRTMLSLLMALQHEADSKLLQYVTQQEAQMAACIMKPFPRSKVALQAMLLG